MPSAAIHAVSLVQFAPFLAKKNIDVLEFFSRQGLSPNIFQAHDAWIPRSVCLKLANALAMETGNPFAGAFLGDSISVPDFGTFGQLVTTAETVETGLNATIENLGLVHRGSTVVPLLEGDSLYLRFSLTGDLDQDPQQLVNASLAVLRNIAMLCKEPDMVTVRLAIPYERRVSILEDCFGNKLQFGCDHNEVGVGREVLDTPIHHSREAHRDSAALDTTIKTAMLVSQMLPTYRVTIDNVASHMAVTRRTLQRRLKECGVVFSDLVDVTRRDAAIGQLRNGRTNLTELAFELGYSELAHFSRSFKRWTGTPPSRYPREP